MCGILKCGLQLLGSYDKTDHCFDDPSHSTSKAEVADVNVECFAKDVSRPKVQFLKKEQ